MADRRMFTQKIIDSDAFLDMPMSSQALYFHLNMRADDDGFINNPKKVLRMIGASEDDLKLLIAKRFVLAFENGVIVIKHWRMHNLIRKDRYHPTQYQEELQSLVNSWRTANPCIVRFWWDVDRAVKTAVKERIQMEVRGIRFFCKSGMLFIRLPSGRCLSYVKPRIGENQFGGESVTYEGIGTTKKWERIESYGPKFVENIVQAVSRDLLCYALQNLSDYRIVGHVHDEVIIECPQDVPVDGLCEIMSKSPPWMPGILIRGDGYQCGFYMKDS